jgi:trimethyllysine dioxygenase
MRTCLNEPHPQTDPCGIQLFHLISHTDGSGGTTLLVDGFHVASVLKEMDPKSYEILSRVCIPAHAAGESDSLYTPSPAAGYPVLSHDSHGKLTQVRWNNDDRSVMSNLHPDEVEDWYDTSP